MKVKLCALLGLAASADALKYKTTVRSFLPSFCVSKKSDFYEAWQYDENGWNRYWRVLENRRPECAYLAGLNSGEISGHPDFNAKGSKGLQPGLSLGTVRKNVKFAPSGLPKPQYCTDDENKRCGTLVSTTGPKTFDAWFNDDAKYNKRVGFELPLRKRGCSQAPDGSERCKYEFNSKTHDEMTPDQTGDGNFFPLTPWVNSTTEAKYPNYEDAPIWPITEYEALGKYWFTTSINTYFEYKGGEEFSFDGDDDVYIFINGQLVVDLGGVHGSRGKSVKLDDVAKDIGIEVGGVYTFDMFHAERQLVGANFKLSTTLVESCNILSSSAQVFAFPSSSQQAAEAGKVPIGFKVRDAAVDERAGQLILASEQGRWKSSYMFLDTQVNVGSGFVADFSFQIGEQGMADGFAFVLLQRPEGLKNMPVSPGSNLGVKYLTNSLAIVFDVHAQQVRMHYNDADPINGYNSVGEDTRQVYEGLRLVPGKEYSVRVQYLERPDFIEVFIDDSLFLRKAGVKIEQVLGNGRDAFVGFTAGTTDSPARVTVNSLSVSSIAISPAKTATVKGQTASKFPADGSAPAQYAVQTFDACENKLTFGGSRQMMKAVYVESLEGPTYHNGSLTPAIIDAEIVDNNDGTYAAKLDGSTDVRGSFDLYICFGDCELDVQLKPASGVDNSEGPSSGRRLQADPGVLVATVALSPNSTDASQFFTIPKIAEAIDPADYSPELAPDNEEGSGVSKSSMLVAASVSATSFVLLGSVLGIFLYRRNKWKKEQGYIHDGRKARMEQNAEFPHNDEDSRVARALFATRASIMRHKARGGSNQEMCAHVADLEEEQDELRLQLRQFKTTDERSRMSSFFKQGKKASKTRKEFAVSTSFQAMP